MPIRENLKTVWRYVGANGHSPLLQRIGKPIDDDAGNPHSA